MTDNSVEKGFKSSIFLKSFLHFWLKKLNALRHWQSNIGIRLCTVGLKEQKKILEEKLLLNFPQLSIGIRVIYDKSRNAFL